MQLREKYEGRRPAKDEMTTKSWQDTIGLDREIQRGKELDRELAELDKPGEKSFTEIERLVKIWKEQKKVQGVEDSDTEKRTQVILNLIKASLCNTRRSRYQEATIYIGHGGLQEAT